MYLRKRTMNKLCACLSAESALNIRMTVQNMNDPACVMISYPSLMPAFRARSRRRHG